MQGSRYPDLSVYVNPAKAVVVDTTASSNVRVFIGQSEVKNDVTAAQLAIWNQGKEPISGNAILETIKIKMVPSVPILEATVRKTNRSVVNFTLNRDELSQGILAVSWNILERGDGGVIQLVYAGNPSVSIVTSGVVVGQSSVHQLRYSGKIRSSAEQIQDRSRERWFMWGLFSVNVLAGAFTIPHYFSAKRTGILSSISWIMIASPVLGGALLIWSLFFATIPSPPFGF